MLIALLSSSNHQPSRREVWPTREWAQGILYTTPADQELVQIPPCGLKHTLIWLVWVSVVQIHPLHKAKLFHSGGCNVDMWKERGRVCISASLGSHSLWMLNCLTAQSAPVSTSVYRRAKTGILISPSTSTQESSHQHFVKQTQITLKLLRNSLALQCLEISFFCIDHAYAI